MSREFNRYIEQEFALRLPEFGLDPDKTIGPLAWPGERCFRSRTEGTIAWVSIFPSHKGYNEFNVEVLWSHLGSFPAALTSRPSMLAVPPACFTERAGGAIRLGAHLETPRLSWAVEGTAAQLAKLSRADAPRVAGPLVAHALQAIQNTGLALVAQAVAARAGYLARSAA